MKVPPTISMRISNIVSKDLKKRLKRIILREFKSNTKMARANHTNKSKVVDVIKREEMGLLENINQVIITRLLFQTTKPMRMRVLLMLKMRSTKMDNNLINKIGRNLKPEAVSTMKESKVDVAQVIVVNNISAITTKVKILVSMFRRISQMDINQHKERQSNKLSTEK